MRKWQILEFDGKPYYAFVPEEVVPIKDEQLPELQDDVTLAPDEQLSDEEEENPNDSQNEGEQDKRLLRASCSIDASAEGEDNCSNDDESMMMQEGYYEATEEDNEPPDIKPVIVNGKVVPPPAANRQPAAKMGCVIPENTYGDLYQVKVEAGVVTLEKLNVETLSSSQQESISVATETITVSKSLFDNTEEDSQDFAGFDEADDAAEDSDEETQEDMGESVTIGVQADDTETEKRVSIAGGGTVSLKCKACLETFESNLAFRKHVAWTHKKKVCIQENGVYICSVCDYRTLKKSLFATHLQRKHETWSRKPQSSTTLFPCAACGFVCRSKHSLQSHFIRKHTDRYEHQCKFCPKKFKVKGDLTNHVRFHHKEKPVNCDVCGKLCLNSGSLYVHQKWAHYKPKYECRICKRRMVTQENLDQHMLMQHEKREKIVCAECGKTFSKKDSFKRHMAVHTGSKPYNCVICSKPFARRSQLRQHLLIHTGKRPFVCDICGKAFTQKPGLICHRKTHPGTHPPLPVMPIGDIVKEFTDGYLKGSQPSKNQEAVEEEQDEPKEEEEDEEEYDEDMEQEEVIEEEVLEEDVEGVKVGQTLGNVI